MSENEALDLIEMVSDDGSTITMRVVDYFFYNGEEYVILTDHIPQDDEETPDRIDCYVMKVLTSKDENGEEMEEFVPIEDEKLEERLMEVASTRLNEEEEEE